MERPGIVPDARGWGCTCLRSDPGRVMVYPCMVPAPPALLLANRPWPRASDPLLEPPRLSRTW